MGRRKLENARSAKFTARFEPKNRYLGELEARRRGMSFNRFVELMVEAAITDTAGEYNDKAVWSNDSIQRFILLATKRPDLLRTEEEEMWAKVQKDSRFLTPTGQPNREAIADGWDELLAYGEAAYADMLNGLHNAFKTAQAKRRKA